MTNLLTVREAAKALRISHLTLYAWASKGKVPTVHLGRRLLFDPEAIQEWIANHSRTETGKVT